mmetsp:Transcript_52883/g.123764  ORF Transcript_52883/g.123764 Transcript_52883/m.123764 type:complete len:132 (+) Transcript_52883:40-435(+)
MEALLTENREALREMRDADRVHQREMRDAAWKGVKVLVIIMIMMFVGIAVITGGMVFGLVFGMRGLSDQVQKVGDQVGLVAKLAAASAFFGGIAEDVFRFVLSGAQLLKYPAAGVGFAVGLAKGLAGGLLQ